MGAGAESHARVDLNDQVARLRVPGLPGGLHHHVLPDAERLVILLPVFRPVFFLNALQVHLQGAKARLPQKGQLFPKRADHFFQAFFVEPGFHLHVLGHSVDHRLIHQFPVGGGSIGIGQVRPVQDLGAHRAQAQKNIRYQVRPLGGGGDRDFRIIHFHSS